MDPLAHFNFAFRTNAQPSAKTRDSSTNTRASPGNLIIFAEKF